jgi:hypothetical protein
VGAVQGFVVVSFPGIDGWKDCADAALIVDASTSATKSFAMVIEASKWRPREMRAVLTLQICREETLFRE